MYMFIHMHMNGTFTYEYTYIYTYIGAVSAISQGKEWDSERKEWIIYDLKQEVYL
jgi:hypothetical protein